MPTNNRKPSVSRGFRAHTSPSIQRSKRVRGDIKVRSNVAIALARLSAVTFGSAGNAAAKALVIEDIQRAADLFKPVYERTNAVDGYVSLEVSPLLAHDTRPSRTSSSSAA